MAYTPDTKLAFCQVSYTPDTKLQFGECNAVVIDNEITLDCVLASVDNLVAIFSCKSQSGVWRGLVSSISCISYGLPVSTRIESQSSLLGTLNKPSSLLWIDGYKLQSNINLPWYSKTNTVDTFIKPRWNNGKPLNLPKLIPWGKVAAVNKPVRIMYSDAIALSKHSQISYMHLQRTTKQFNALFVNGGMVSKQVTLPYHNQIVIINKDKGIVYTHGKPLTPGIQVWLPNLYVPTPIPEYTPGTRLSFLCPFNPGTKLRFREPACDRFTVPIQGSYMITNSFSLIRVDNSTPLYATSFSLSINADSWAWTWSANIHGIQIDDVLSTNVTNPIEVLATLNGATFKLVIEKVSRSRSFNKDSLSVSGRGLSCYLSSPYSPITTLYSANAITAQQAAVLALTYNAVPIGWDVEWNLDDWLIAGGALSNTGTYIDHLIRIADAAGGYLQPMPATETMRFIPYYPVVPWEWGGETPSIILPDSAVVTESIEYINKAEYNGVYIHGGDNGGVIDFIKITGTDGATQANTIVDDLATDSIMTRQRGIKVLSDTGRIVNYTISLPIFDSTGIILPGTMIQYTSNGVTKKGLTRSLSISYSMPKARQQIEIETHEYI